MFKTISSKLLVRMLIVTLIGLAIGLSIIIQSSNRLQETTAANLTREKHDQAMALIHAKIDTTLATVTSFVSANPQLGRYYQDNDFTTLHQITNRVVKDFADTTNHRGLSFVGFDAQNNIFMRSFANLPDPAIGRKAPRSFSELLTGKLKNQAEIDLSAVGLFVTATVPVKASQSDNQIVGVLDMRAGLGSVVRDMKKYETYFVAVINDKGKERWKKATENPALGSYHLAHSSWFNDSASWFNELDIDQHIQNGFGIENNKAITSSPIKNSDGDVIGHYIVGVDMSHPDMINAMEGVNHIIFIMILLVIVIMLALMIYLWHSTQQLVNKPIQQIMRTIQQVEQTGHFNLAEQAVTQDEVGQMQTAFSSMIKQLNQAITEANHTVQAIAQGQFDQTMQGNYQGDLDLLKQGINQSAHSVAFMTSELNKVMSALQQGRFDVKMDEKVAEGFRRNTEITLKTMETVLHEINNTLNAMQKGDFSQRVTAQAKGEFDRVKQHVNQSLDALQNAIQEITQVMSAQAQGDLTQQIKGQYQGSLQSLKEAINRSGQQLNQLVKEAITISGEVNNAAQEVSKGAMDLSDRVQQQAASI